MREPRAAHLDSLSVMETSQRIAAAVAAGVLLMIGGGAVMGRALEKSRARAQENACRANVRQVSMAMLMYLADYDDRFPPAERWSDGLHPYLRNDLVFTCPAELRLPRGCAMNRSLSGAPRAGVVAPAETPILLEARIEGRNPAADLSALVSRHPAGGFTAAVDGRVHQVRTR